MSQDSLELISVKKIDFVIDWVDGADPEWNAVRNKYNNNNGDTRDLRYREWGLLKYWFRSVEMNAPWVNKIYFVTFGHLPEWLNTNHPKIQIINHSDYIPDEFLPTFNSNSIELLINKIPNLSEQFVFFNDDFYINAPVKSSDFFDANGIPRDSGILSPQLPKKNSITHITTNNLEIINEHFSRDDVIKNIFKFVNFKYGKQNVKTIATLPWHILLGFHDLHIPIAFRKKTFDYVWSLEGNNLEKTLQNKFRSNDDYNIWLFRYFQLLRGDFVPRNASFGKYYDITNDNKSIIDDVEHGKHHLIVLNDQEVENFETIKQNLNDAFQKRYPLKSEFEK